jgi:lipopolysaccharide/colanic/teichoic acid biosynthesis glycosyltransferase
VISITTPGSKTSIWLGWRSAALLEGIFRRRRRSLLVVGDTRSAAAVGAGLAARRWARRKIAETAPVQSWGNGFASSIVKEALSVGAEEVALCPTDAGVEEILKAVRTIGAAGLSVHVCSHSLSNVARRLPGATVRVDGTPVVSFKAEGNGRISRILRRAADCLISAAALVALAPFWVIVAAVLLAVQGRPVLFRQRRIGSGGRSFRMYKFRTMRRRSQWPPKRELDGLNVRKGPMFKARHDPRVTAIGRWLRRFCIDETPQLINVLKGDMSLVGTRPPLPGEVSRYEKWHHARLEGAVGITGLWQISDRKGLEFEDVVALDFYYDRNRSLALDLRILAGTFGAVFAGRAAS